MHIAFLTPEYPHALVVHSAGIGTSIKNLANALISAGHMVTLFIYGQSQNIVFEENHIQVHLIKRQSYKIGGFYLYRKYIQRYINANSAGIDVIEAPDWTGITAFMRLNKPHLIRLHGSDTYFCHLEGRKQKWKNRYFERQALSNATAIASVSAFTAQQTKALFGLKREIPVIHNLIDLDKFLPNHDNIEPATILNFGSIIRKKGVIALAKAFNILAKQHATAQVRFVGKDITDARTGKFTSELILNEIEIGHHNRVQFMDAVPYEQVQEYIKKATVVCLPSYAEAFPMTWLEAMALEKPLITSDIGWASEIMVNKKTGITIHPDDTATFASELLNMLNETVTATIYGKQARAHLMKYFKQEELLNINSDFYNSLIKKQ